MNTGKFFPRKSIDMFGKVISISGNNQKTVKVLREYTIKNTKYNKIINKRTSYLVHDDSNQCQKLDKVVFYVTRPISKHKHMVIKEVLKRNG